jgi:hypothetical protein
MRAVELGLAGGSEQAVTADVVQARREHVLEQALEKHERGKSLVYDLAGSVALEAKGYLAAFEALESAVGQGVLEQVAAEVVEDSLAIAGTLSVHDPTRSP